MTAFPPTTSLFIEAFRERKTGVIQAQHQDGSRQVLIENGVPVFAISEAATDKLPEIIIQKGLMTRDQFVEVEANLDHSKSIGKNLVDMGVITQKELVEGAKEQVFSIFSKVINDFECEAQLEEKEEVGEVKLPLKFPRDYLRAILQNKNKTGIANYFNETLSNRFRLVSDTDLDPDELAFDSRLENVPAKFDGESDLAQILLEVSQLDEFTLMKLVFALWSWGFLEDIPLEEQADEIQDELASAVGGGSALPETVEVGQVHETQELRPEEMGLGAIAPPEPKVSEEDFDEDLPMESESGFGLEQDEEEEQDYEIEHPDMVSDVDLETDEQPEVDDLSVDEEPPFYKRKLFLFNSAAAVMILASIFVWSKMAAPEPNDGPPDPVFSELEQTDSEDVLPSNQDDTEAGESDIVDQTNTENSNPKSDQEEKASNQADSTRSVAKGPPENTQPQVDLAQGKHVTEEPEREQTELPSAQDSQSDPRRFRSPVVDGELPRLQLKDQADEMSSRPEINPLQPEPDAKNDQIPKDLPKEAETVRPSPPETLPKSTPELLDLPDVPSGEPRDLLAAGNLNEAAKLWARQYSDQAVSYSIALELACQEQTVMNGFRASRQSSEFFILPRKLDGRSCFWLCWGRFKTRAEAEAAKPQIPDFFKYGGNPKVRLFSELYKP